MGKTKIEWATDSWNPITGCTPISEGCTNCYAEKMAHRLKVMGIKKYSNGFKVTLHPEELDKPLHWKKPRTIFVCSMGDLFHDDVLDGFILDVWNTMKSCPQHTFIILTKRADRLCEFVNRLSIVNGEVRLDVHNNIGSHAVSLNPTYFPDIYASVNREPLSSVWLGVTCENQRTADERIPLLLQTPAAKRFISLEPLLGPIDLTSIRCHEIQTRVGPMYSLYTINKRLPGNIGIDLAIVGGETGLNARECRERWVKDIYDQCKAAGVPFFFKQRGKNWEHHYEYANGQSLELTHWEKRREWPK